MKSSALVVWLCLILGCLSQEVTNREPEPVTETSTGTNAAEWDGTRPTATVTIGDGQEGRFEPQPQNEIPRYPLFYANQWRPMVMPFDTRPFGARLPKQTAESQKIDELSYHLPIPLRPDAEDGNWTSPTLNQQYPQPSEAVRHSVNTPFMQWPPVFYYPQPLPAELPIPYPFQSTHNVQNLSSPLPRPFFYGHGMTPSSDGNADSIPLTPGNIPDHQYFLHNAPPVRNPENGLVPGLNVFTAPPEYFPPPASYSDRENPEIPTINIFVRPPTQDREPISEPEKTNPTQELTPEAARIIPTEAELPKDNAIPSSPFPTLPFPLNPFSFGGFPFGVVPQFFPPIPSVGPRPLVPENLPVGAPSARPVLQTDSVTSDHNLLANILPPQFLPSPKPVEPSPEPALPVNPTIPPSSSEAVSSVDGEIPLSEVPPVDKSPYAFGYEMNDGNGTDQHRQESSDATGVVTGSYGYRDAYGVYRFVNYVADKDGFRAFIKTNEPGVASTASADVIMLAERPPPHALAEAAKATDLKAVVVPDEVDLIAEGSDIK